MRNTSELLYPVVVYNRRTSPTSGTRPITPFHLFGASEFFTPKLLIDFWGEYLRRKVRTRELRTNWLKGDEEDLGRGDEDDLVEGEWDEKNFGEKGRI